MKVRLLSLALLAALIIGTLALPVLAAPLDAKEPALKLDPDRGPHGTTTAISVFGFTAGQTCQVFWDSDYQTDIEINEIGEGNSSMFISDKYSIGWHKITVSGCNQTSDWAQADFEVIELASPTFTPQKPTETPTPTSTKQPGQPGACGPGTCTVTPSITPTPTAAHQMGLPIYPIIIPPREPYSFVHIPRSSFPPAQICSGLPANSGQRIFTFDELVPGDISNTYTRVSAGYGLTFSNATADDPALGTRSGSMAVRSLYDDMGSYDTPIRMSFSLPLSMIGMYVGREAPQYDRGVVSAVLTGYGYDYDGQYRDIAMAAIDLPAAALDITRCLSIRAPDGLSLRSATLEYYTQDGRSALDVRWMDDLTVVMANSGLITDNPPVVTIRNPLQNSTINDDGGVMLQVQVSEDIRLDSLSATVNGGTTAIPITFVHASGGDPTRYEGSLQLTNANGLTPNAANTIQVTAVDSNRGAGSAQVNFQWQPRPPLNIEAYKVEIIQVVQCLDNVNCPDNAVPMVDDKPALVRLYVRSNGREVPNIGGRLCLEARDVYCTSNYIESYNRVMVTNSGNPVADFRGNLDRTINFMIPASVLARIHDPYFNLSVSVNYEGRDILETRYDDNAQWLRVYVEPHKTLEIAFVPVCIFRDGHYTCPTNPRLAMGHILTFISHMYPTHTIEWVVYSNHTVETSHNIGVDDDDSGCNHAWDDILSSLWWFNVWTSDFASWVRYYGMVPDAVRPNGHLGCGYTPGDESGGIINGPAWSDATTAAEEIGHNHYLKHAPSGGAAGADPNYPNSDGKIDDWGLDIYTMRLYDPANTYDFMGYAGYFEYGEWASTYNYMNLMYNISVEAESLEHWLEQINVPGSGRAAAMIVPRQQGTPMDALVISGYISPSGVEIAPDGVQHVTVYDPPANPSVTGPYTIQLLDAQGAVLYTSPWFAAEVDDGEQAESGAFHAVVPWKEGTTTIWFNYNGGVIGGIAGNDTLPGAEITEPVGDVTWGESGTAWVYWVGKDAEALTYSLQFSADGGVTWQILASGLTETQFEVDLASLPGTTQGKLRLVASDGFNTASADTQGMITIPNKAPLLVITSPQEGYSVPQTYPLILEGIGTDYEDGPLGTQGFRWVSNIDGELGSGTGLILSDLSVGQHTLSLLATDSQGMTGETTVQVNIQPAPTPVVIETLDPNIEVPQSGATQTPQPAVTPAPAGAGDDGLLVGLLIGLGVAVVAVAAVLLIKRKK